MRVREIEAKTLLSSAKQPDPWFGIKYTMNLYRGCEHHCIYCDSRSECYQIADFDGEVLVKANALDLLRKELPRKRVKGYVGTGSMNDPYQPLERVRWLTRGALEIIAALPLPGPHHYEERPRHRAMPTAVRDPRCDGPARRCRQLHDHDAGRRSLAQSRAGRAALVGALRRAGSAGGRGDMGGVTLMPVLPFIEDDEESVRQLVTRAAECGAKYVIPAWGVTLRNRQRTYYYEQLDRLFPGVREKYEWAFGERYSAGSPNGGRLQRVLDELAARFGLERRVPAYPGDGPRQLTLC